MSKTLLKIQLNYLPYGAKDWTGKNKKMKICRHFFVKRIFLVSCLDQFLDKNPNPDFN